ncbi:MAG: HTH domain-containing protein [Chloroflexi bacterium]|nr:HTH domain-containing protein [Chloroflexota bacterium]
MPATKYTFQDFAEEVLNEAKKPLTFQEIWSTGVDKGLSKKFASLGKTPWQSLGARLFVDIRDNPSTRLIKVGKNPSRFFLAARKSELTEEDLRDTATSKVVPAKREIGFDFHERQLHPLLAYFAFTNTAFNRGKQIYTKTIFHEKSKHNSLSEWVHPDMVGFYSPIDDWNGKLLEFNKATDKTAIRLFSFELKKQIDRSNYREYFFQAVSNSSWAHEGYLVASYVQQQDDLLSELERLSTSFGIGIIFLDLDDIDSSTVLFPAKSKDYLDWETMNKLCEQNPDFETFIDDVQRDYAGKKIHPSEYEPITNDPEEYIKKIRAGK